jgi:hypothetical protein
VTSVSERQRRKSRAQRAESGHIYYEDIETGETTWEDPEPETNWTQVSQANGKVVFVHKVSGEESSSMPPELIAALRHVSLPPGSPAAGSSGGASPAREGATRPTKASLHLVPSASDPRRGSVAVLGGVMPPGLAPSKPQRLFSVVTEIAEGIKTYALDGRSDCSSTGAAFASSV